MTSGMNKETIEKAARDYAEQLYPCSGDKMEGFKAGAKWRINSVWHKPSAYGEELKRDVEVIAKTKRGYRFGKFNVVGWFHEYIAFVSTSSLEYALSDVLEYAYLDDLLPDTRKEADQ